MLDGCVMVTLVEIGNDLGGIYQFPVEFEVSADGRWSCPAQRGLKTRVP